MTPMVRPATVDDLDEIVRMAAAFQASAYPEIPFSTKAARFTAVQLIESEKSALLLLEQAGTVRGMLGAIMFPVYFSLSHRVVQEMFWWVDHDARGHGQLLLDALEHWALVHGANEVMMLTLANEQAAALASFYTRRGYSQGETSFRRAM